MLTVENDLPHDARRILVAGVSGVGKSTLARQLASTLDIPYTELDSLFHGAGWTERPTFLDDVDTLISQDAWVTEWQYPSARARLVDRAQALVWLDLPSRITLTRVARRTLRRRLRREQLWNGNVEPPLRTFFTDKEHILRWAISTRGMYRELVPALESSHPDLAIVRLRSTAEVESWVARHGD